jgi:hypothetical protein
MSKVSEELKDLATKSLINQQKTLKTTKLL